MLPNDEWQNREWHDDTDDDPFQVAAAIQAYFLSYHEWHP